MSTTENTSRIRYVEDERIAGIVKIWLIVGLFMVFMQIVIGGVTRLTGSGLSITRWEVVTGTLPPLNDAAWEEAFDLYKTTPQYQKINQGMAMSDFKFIFFWEYFHRLWARLMFFVFIIPFGWFWWRGMFSRRLMRRLPIVVLLAALEGFFGWIMVASGLRSRPWVNAYNLTLHLVMGLVIFSYLLQTIFIAYKPRVVAFAAGTWKRYFNGLVLLAFVQIGLGAMMSGTKAGLFYPTWPDQGGVFLPGMLLDGSLWSVDSFTHYDINPFVPALIQFLHRNTAYLLTALVLYAVWKMSRHQQSSRLRIGNRLLVLSLLVQVILGIVTLLQCQGSIPVTLGVLHQAGAVVLLSVLLYVTYQVHGTEQKVS